MPFCTRLSVAVVLALAILACARHKELVPTGGSRADGSVTLSYEFGAGEIPKIDIEQGRKITQAIDRDHD